MEISSRDAHAHHSSLREKIVEHLFLGESLRILWSAGVYEVEVSRAESDSFGYDVVLEPRSLVRHIQLKSGLNKPRQITVAESLSKKPSGCVVFVQVSENLGMGPFYWFGNTPGKALPPIDGFPLARRTTPNREGKKPMRRNHRSVPGNKFIMLPTMADVLMSLFGHEMTDSKDG